MGFVPRRILVGTDFSEGAARAAQGAVELAKALGGEVTLLHVVPPSAYGDDVAARAGTALWEPELRSKIFAEVRAQLDRERERLGSACIATRIAEGAASAELVRVAQDEGFELVVVGTRGRTGVERVLLGSVAEAVVRHSLVPVLTLRGARPRSGPA